MDRRAKIKALADDVRGDPAVRARAQEWLARHPESISPLGVVPGVTPSSDYLAWRKGQHVPRKKDART